MRIDQIELSGSLSISSSLATNPLVINDDYLFVSNTGNVGIGTNNPTSKLVVTGSVSVQGSMVATSLVGSLTGSVKLPTIAQGTSETNIVLVNESGGLVYRSNISLTGAQGTSGIEGGVLITVLNSGFNYMIDGYEGNFPTLTLVRGQLYYFDVSSFSVHPFALRLSAGNTSNVLGTTNNDSIYGVNANSPNSIIEYRVPYNAPNSIVYQCTVHPNMLGVINIVNQNGDTGAQGTQGIQGTNGTIGVNGAQGNQGPTGLQGTLGTQGNQGSTGPQGTGISGGAGSQGFQGSQGPTGLQGTAGTNGTNGTQGNQGPIGVQGTSGTVQMAIIRETTNANVASSVTYTNYFLQQLQSKPRQINSKTEAGLGITLSGSPNWTFTISTAGTYLFEATAMLSVPISDGQTVFGKLLLNNITLSLGSVIVGDSYRYGPVNNSLVNSNFPHTMNGIYTITGITIFRLDHVIISQYFPPTGGKPSNVSGHEEVYATLKITKIN